MLAKKNEKKCQAPFYHMYEYNVAYYELEATELVSKSDAIS